MKRSEIKMPSFRSLYRASIPADKTEIIKRLERMKKRVVDLEQQLVDAQQTCIDLEKEVQEYLLPTCTSSKPINYINRCPPEILLIIFTFTLKGDYHPLIRRLLLVCKSWYSLIMNTPILWSRVHAILDTTRVWSKLSLRPYIEACFTRSRDLKLDLYISCARLLEAEDTAARISVERMKDIGEDRISERSLRVHGNSKLITSRIYKEDEALGTLVDTRTAQMKRWRSLVFVGPPGLEEHREEPLFCEEDWWPTSALESLEVKNLREYHQQAIVPRLKDVSALRSLTTERWRDFREVADAKARLTRLNISTTCSVFDAKQMSGVSTLQSLKLFFRHDPSGCTPSRPRTDKDPIHLPELKHLDLGGCIARAMAHQWIVSNLKIITIYPGGTFLKYRDGLPKTVKLDFRPRWEGGRVVPTVDLDAVLSVLSGVEHLQIDGLEKEEIVDAIQGLRERLQLPRSIQKITTRFGDLAPQRKSKKRR